jgi:enoyl-CoA hydratase
MQLKSEVLFEEMQGQAGNLGVITLNRPEVLNALNQTMFNAVDKQLEAWDHDDHIKAVVIRAVEGRAFCAGGDIRAAYEKAKAKDPALPEFFGDEYRMNKRIYHFSKPYIALMDGITMGGGVGISIHGSHRVATDRYLFSMPETGIGFYPDVGATYFLPRLRNKVGYYLGLTGAKIDYQDCFVLGLIDHVVGRDAFPDILKKLADTPFSKNPDAAVSDILNFFHAPVGESVLFTRLPAIEVCFSKNTVEEIMKALEYFPDAWCQLTETVMSTKSPTSLRVTLRQLQEGSKLKFDACMDLEYQLTRRFIQGHDFFEGIRAVVIDKDYAPHWRPAKLDAVMAADVDSYFSASEKLK